MTNPTPETIRIARIAARLTQTQAGALLGKSCRAWQSWEADTAHSSHRAMDGALFELFLIKAKTGR